MAMDTPIIDTEEIISIVAKKHKVLLDEHDPILVTVTLNQVIAGELVKLANASMEQLQISLEEVYYRQQEESKTTAQKIMTATLNNARSVITETAKQSSDELADKIKVQQELFLARCEENLAQQQKAKITTIIFSCAAIASAVVAATVFLVS